MSLLGFSQPAASHVKPRSQHSRAAPLKRAHLSTWNVLRNGAERVRRGRWTVLKAWVRRGAQDCKTPMTAAMAPQCRRPLRVDLRQVCEEVLGFVHGYGKNGVWRHRWNVPSSSSNLVIHSSVWNLRASNGWLLASMAMRSRS